MTLQKIAEGIYIDEPIKESLNEIDAVIFDCDGVLVDVSKSYDLAIQLTTSYILKNIVKLENCDQVTSEIIEGFKSTGGFNDEVDLTYATIISLSSAHNLKKSGNQFIFEVIKNADQTGIVSVEKFLKNIDPKISELIKRLSYPGRHSENVIYNIFDQIFYGPEQYFKLFKKKSQFTERGLIDNDIILITKELLEKLKKKFHDNISIVSGRGMESIRYTLKDLLNEFNLKNSVFLEDEPRELAKPNPNSLLRSINGINSTHTLFVGDSMEDFIMAKKVSNVGKKTTFCGIIGTSKNPEGKKKIFEEKNVQIIINSIEELPKILNLV